MFCIYCGVTLPEGAKKCTLCGNPVVRPPEAGRGRHLLKFDREPLRSGTDTRS